MHPETFEHQAAVYEYAERNGLTYAWEGSPAFAKRLRVLSPEQYQHHRRAHAQRGPKGAAVLEGRSRGRVARGQASSGQARSKAPAAAIFASNWHADVGCLDKAITSGTRLVRSRSILPCPLVAKLVIRG